MSKSVSFDTGISSDFKESLQISDSETFFKTPTNKRPCLDSESGIYTPFLNRVNFVNLFLTKTSNGNLIDKILLYLGPRDLTALDCVCKQIHDHIRANRYFNEIRSNFLLEVQFQKENLENTETRTSTPCDSTFLLPTPNTYFKKYCVQFGTIKKCTICPSSVLNQRKSKGNSSRSPEVSPSKREWFKFLKASKKLSPDEKLTRCVRCSNPARIFQNVTCCLSPGCSFICCDQCWDPECQSVEYLKCLQESNENIYPEIGTNQVLPPPCSKTDVQTKINYLNKSTLSDISNNSCSIFPKNKALDDTPSQIQSRSRVKRLLFSMQASISMDAGLSGSKTQNRFDRANSLQMNTICESNDLLTPPDSPPKLEHCSMDRKSVKKRLKRL